MNMQVGFGESVAVPQYAPRCSDAAAMQVMLVRAHLIDTMIQRLVLLTLIAAMTMPQPETECQTSFANYNVSQETGSSSQQQKTERVFQKRFNRPQESKKAEYTPPPAPKIVPKANPETLSFIQTKVPGAKNGDPYSFLGLTSQATTEEVKKAYRKIVLKFHPDKNPGDKQATEAFKVVKEAYEMIIPPNDKPLS